MFVTTCTNSLQLISFIFTFTLQDARESITEIGHLDHSMLVQTMLEKLVEKAGKTRKLLGQMLYDMIKEHEMSLDALIKG